MLDIQPLPYTPSSSSSNAMEKRRSSTRLSFSLSEMIVSALLEQEQPPQPQQQQQPFTEASTLLEPYPVMAKMQHTSPSKTYPKRPSGYLSMSPEEMFSADMIKQEDDDDEQECGLPGEKSIIAGRHKLAFNHIANRRFRVTINLALPKYKSLTRRTERSLLIREIVDSIYGAGGNFLKPTSGSASSWMELSEKEARNKVGHALRDAAAAEEQLHKRHQGQPPKASKKDKAEEIRPFELMGRIAESTAAGAAAAAAFSEQPSQEQLEPAMPKRRDFGSFVMSETELFAEFQLVDV